MSVLRRETRSWAPEPIASPFPGTSFFGASSNAPSVGNALQVSAVWACVRLLADSVSMMPMSAFTMKDGSRVPVADPPLLIQPSADASMPDWIYMLMVSALLRGNAYGHVTRRDALGYPMQIELVDPDRVQVRQSTEGMNGTTSYSFSGVTIPNEEVFHFRAFRFPGMAVGLSPIQYARTAIYTDIAISDCAYGYFRDGAHPSSLITSEKEISQDQAKTIKERVTAAVKGREPLTLGAGLKWQQIQVNPEESQFLATQKLGNAGIARIFGVPPEMIASEAGNSMTYATLEGRSLDFLVYSVQSWLTRIEAAFRPLLPGAKHVRFDTRALVRTDFETTMKATAIGIASKQMTPDEARALRDEPPLTPAQKRDLDLVPLTVSPGGTPKDLPGAPPVGEGEPAKGSGTGLVSLMTKETPA